MSVRVIGALVAFLWAAGGGLEPMPANAEDARFGLCAELPYRTCVHNGDLIYLRGQPIRLGDIETPDRYTANCPAASNIAWYAAIRLRDLLNEGPFDIIELAAPQQAAGEELVRRLERNGISLGDTLVAEGLAQRRSAQRTDWCAED
jgi:endonuclease YncB( thermonuclease family)